MKAECHAFHFKFELRSHEVTHIFAMATNGLQTVFTRRVREQTCVQVWSCVCYRYRQDLTHLAGTICHTNTY